MWDGFKAEQEGRILPSLPPCSTQRHPTATPLLDAICDPGWECDCAGYQHCQPEDCMCGQE